MIRTIRTVSAMASVGILAACQSLPTLPTTIFSGADPACAEIAPGPSAFTPPFPANCPGMNKTATGVRYIPITHGDQAAGSPGPDATIVVEYEAFLADRGTLIDSSYLRGESSVYSMADLIDGWAEAVQLMNPGDEWLVFVPAAQAFDDQPVGDLIPPYADLVYRVKLDGFLSANQLAAAAAEAPAEQPPALSTRDVQATTAEGIVEPRGPDMPAWQAYYPWDGDRPGVNTLPSGVSYVTLERGNSTARNALKSDQVMIHYEGRLAATGDFFDSSWSRGEPALFGVEALIPGFTEALTYMRPGDRILVHIPSDQAYGAQGAGDAVPPNADLMFQIVLLQIQPQD